MTNPQWRNAYRDLVWESDLCPQHKLLLLAILHFVNSDGVAWPSLTTLAQRVSMSRTAVSRYLKDLDGYGWIIKRTATFLPVPGRKPNAYWLPQPGTIPQQPPHCQQRHARTRNLRRGGNEAWSANAPDASIWYQGRLRRPPAGSVDASTVSGPRRPAAPTSDVLRR